MRVVIADDSSLFRRVLTEALNSFPDVEVVGTAQNGKIALSRVNELHPDILTLDMEMPEMDGLAVLDTLKSIKSNVSVLVVSAQTLHGGDLTMKALEKGAFDFITKPDSLNATKSIESIKQELQPRLKALKHRLEIRSILRSVPQVETKTQPPKINPVPITTSKENLVGVAERMNRLRTLSPEMVLIGVSTGGPNALAEIIPKLPKDLGVPILIVQHMPPIFTQSLAQSLASKSVVKVVEATSAMTPQPNTVYIAPGGKQMRLCKLQDGTYQIQITDDPPENNCKPSVDYLFRSVAQCIPGRSLAIILTGMGSDGTLGLRLLKRQGSFIIAQDEASCVVYGMPKAAVDAGVVDSVLPLNTIAAQIQTILRGKM